MAIAVRPVDVWDPVYSTLIPNQCQFSFDSVVDSDRMIRRATERARLASGGGSLMRWRTELMEATAALDGERVNWTASGRSMFRATAFAELLAHVKDSPVELLAISRAIGDDLEECERISEMSLPDSDGRKRLLDLCKKLRMAMSEQQRDPCSMFVRVAARAEPPAFSAEVDSHPLFHFPNSNSTPVCFFFRTGRCGTRGSPPGCLGWNVNSP